MSASYRRAFFPSGAKDDNGDTLLLLDLLRHHRDRLSALQPDTPETRLLRFLSEDRRSLVEQKVSVVQQLTDSVAHYFPQIRNWLGPLDTPLCDGTAGALAFPAAVAAVTSGHPETVPERAPLVGQRPNR
jgi:hypothetical protein